MKKALVRLASALLLLAVLWAGQGTRQAYACSCGKGLGSGEPDNRPEAVQAADRDDAVFVGRVLGGGAAPPSVTGEMWTSAQYLLSVEEVWKGVETSQVYVYSSTPECCMCGYPFATGQSYLVYADMTESGKLSTIICNRTMSLVNAAQDIKELGPGRKPTVNVSLPNPGGPIAVALQWAPGGAALIVIVGGALMVRTVRRRRKKLGEL